MIVNKNINLYPQVMYMNEYVIYSSINNNDFDLKAACLDKFDNIEFLHKSRNISFGASYSEYCRPCKKAFLSLSYSYIGNTVYTINDKKYHVRQGEFIIHGRGSVTNQTAANGGSVSYTLSVSPHFCKKYGFCDDMICQITDDKLKNMFFDLIKAFDNDETDTASTVFLQLLMHINHHYKKYSAGVSDVGTLSDTQMLKVIKYINRNICNKIHLNDMAQVLRFHPVYFSRAFKKTCGYSPIVYANFLRCKNACQLLLTTDFTPKEIIEFCGFYSMAQFKNMYKKLIGRDVERDAKTPPVVISLREAGVK